MRRQSRGRKGRHMKNVLEYLEKTAGAFPRKTGFTDHIREVTFVEAEENAKRIASSVISAGTGRPVAVMIDRSVACIEAMMGAVYGGCFYTVIDIHSPENRIKEIMRTLSPAAVIACRETEQMAGRVYKGGNIIVYEEAVKSETDEEAIGNIRKDMIDTDPLYILFTSGSSGAPKGTVVSHRSVMNYTEWVSGEFGFDENTSFGSQTPLYFSMSVTDLFSTLKCGGTFHIIPREYFAFPMKLIEVMNRRRVNTIYWVPSAMALLSNWDAFAYDKPSYLQKVLFAGEVMPVKHLNYWMDHLPDCMYANLFGPTETTDICTFYVVDRRFRDNETLPIGKACDNCSVTVLTEEGREAGTGETGELLVRGSFLADGYYNDMKRTEKAFVQNPLNDKYPEKVYRTGDLVRKNERGELTYAGRKDLQMKRMGYRIEAGEIEAAAAAVQGVRSAAAVQGEDGRIILIYEGACEDTETVRKKAEAMLPPYMMPDRVVRVESMPYNSNGKIDRRSLREII